jgi:two-component sensor histidine kinase
MPPLLERIARGTFGPPPLQEMRGEVLELIARGRPLETVLTTLSTRCEKLLPGSVVGVCILDRAAQRFEDAYFPSLAASFAEGIRGARVADKPGTCAAAIFNGTVVTSEDIGADARFLEGWRALNLEHGIKSIQSRPVFSEDGLSLGTIVIGFKESRSVAAFDDQISVIGAELAGIALARERVEQQRTLFLGEMQHRLRNVFAKVAAVVYATLRNHSDPKEFRKAFDLRLMALSRANDIDATGSVELQPLLSSILAPHADEDRLRLEGPRILLARDGATAFALAINELATNATKYGALSNDQGHVDVRWSVEGDDAGNPMFRMTWMEAGGPPVTPPDHAGFGTRTVTQSLKVAIDGEVDMAFLSDGVVCSVKAPLTERLGAVLPGPSSAPSRRTATTTVSPLQIWQRPKPADLKRLPN